MDDGPMPSAGRRAGSTAGPLGRARRSLTHGLIGLRRRRWRHRAARSRRRRLGPAADHPCTWPGVTVAPPTRDGTQAEPWLVATAAAQPRRRAGAPSTDAVEVTMVCVSNRPENLGAVLANHERQAHAGTRLLLVTNSADFALDEVRARVRAAGADHLDIDQGESLGACLNEALLRCATRYVAKVDDDDWYGPEYLGDMLRTHLVADATVVGKHSYFAHLAGPDLRVLRFPGRELEYTSTVAGGTLVIDLERLPAGVVFPERTVGEDTGFLDRCQRRGGAVFAADRFNYLQHRGDANTWTVDVEHFLAGSMVVEPGSAAATIEV